MSDPVGHVSSSIVRVLIVPPEAELEDEEPLLPVVLLDDGELLPPLVLETELCEEDPLVDEVGIEVEEREEEDEDAGEELCDVMAEEEAVDVDLPRVE